MKKKFVWKKALYLLIVLIICITLSFWLLDERAAQIISILSVIIVAAVVLVGNLEKPGARQIILMASPIFSNFLKVLASMDFTKYLTAFYNNVINFVCKRLNIDFDYSIGSHTSLMITFWIVFCLVYFIWGIITRENSKNIPQDSEPEFREKNFTEKSMLFCRTLRQRLERINSKTDWNENLFTPIEAEIEACVNGKRKKKYDDLLKCLKKNRRHNTVFLVLGDPGSGKSVSLRKLCLELLDEYNKTKRIPVYIDLKKWNIDWDLNHLPSKKDLIDFIKMSLYEDGDVFTDEFLNSYFDKMLENGRWYFIFDSFDELPCLMGKRSCQELIDHISTILYEFVTGPNQNGGVIASRLYKSPSDTLRATVILRIQEFSDIKIKIMLQKYLNSATEVVKELFGKREDLVVLCRNPFYLTLLINFIRENGTSFPKNQVELYSNFVKVRLNKCVGKIENEHMSVDEIHSAAKKLAVYMQQSTIYGLECPAKILYEKEDEHYWRTVLGLLKYAKICRFGGSEETVSFVHRRFQEFFLVESIIERKEDIDQEEYESIVNNSGLRDALVLYCEIAEEEKAKDIAKYCWNVVKNNIQQKENILNKGCIELVNTLYFMAEAFRNRKSALEDYLDEFQKLVEDNLDEKADFVVQYALTDSMVLFEQNRIQPIVLRIFQLKNRWLTDVVMKNCRIINKLDSRIEKNICNYFRQLDLKTFFERFRNTQFSLSLSKSFRYVKTVHLSLFFANAAIAITTILAVGLFVVFILNELQVLSVSTVDWYPQEVADDIGFFEQLIGFIKSLDLILKKDFLSVTFILVAFLFMFFSQKSSYGAFMKISLPISSFMLLAFALIVMQYGIFWGHLWIAIVLLIFVLNMAMQIIHDTYYIIKKYRFISLLKKMKYRVISLLKFALLEITIILFSILLAFLLDKFVVFTTIFLFVCFLFLIGTVIFLLILFLRDWYWVKHQPYLQKISREMLAKNLDRLSFQKYKCEYVDSLLRRKVTLTGTWPKNVRPKSSNDELTYKLAMLDCAELENFNNHF